MSTRAASIVFVVAALMSPACTVSSDEATPADDPITVRCDGSIAKLDFDPDGHIEARVGSETVAWADAERRRVDEEACERVGTQSGWFVGIRYSRVRKVTSLTCRIPGPLSVSCPPDVPKRPLP